MNGAPITANKRIAAAEDSKYAHRYVNDIIDVSLPRNVLSTAISG